MGMSTFTVNLKVKLLIKINIFTLLFISMNKYENKWLELWNSKLYELHQDSAPNHSALPVQIFLSKYNILVFNIRRIRLTCYHMTFICFQGHIWIKGSQISQTRSCKRKKRHASWKSSQNKTTAFFQTIKNSHGA